MNLKKHNKPNLISETISNDLLGSNIFFQTRARKFHSTKSLSESKPQSEKNEKTGFSMENLVILQSKFEYLSQIIFAFFNNNIVKKKNIIIKIKGNIILLIE